MSDTPSAVPAVVTRLLGLWHWRARPTATDTAGKSVTRSHQPAQVEPARLLNGTMHKPLRIVRMLDADHAPGYVGRMMISGRMADVCAELDRLAALH